MPSKAHRVPRIANLPQPVESLIRVVRREKVMLDSDLARLYGVPTGRLNESVKRNSDRFPDRFVFQLTENEVNDLRSQIAISNPARGGRRYLPYAFTEHGVVMLSSVLNSPRAIKMAILVVDVFVRMRELMATHKDIAARVEKLERGHERTASIIEALVEDIDRLGRKVERLKAPEPLYTKHRIGYMRDDET